MKNALIFISLFVVVIVGKAQQSVRGVLLDETSDEAVEFAHVNNITNKEGTITSLKGTFEIKASEGDTIVFSIVGYQRIGWKVKPSWFEENIILKLARDTIFLDEVTVNNLPSEEVFKRRILSYEPEDTAFWYHGIPKPKPYNNAPLSEKQINNPLFAILQPTDFLYEKFSKSAKEKRKYHQIVTTQTRDQRVYQKFNRDWVKDVTGLEGDELTSFIDYCDYSLEYLDKTELFFIQQDMLAKLSEFKKSERG